MSEQVELKYRAFISYSHADTNWAKWLHRGLESFHIDKDLVGRVTARGAIPQALRPIFRDRDEFTAGHALAEQTLAALDDSHALIVVCSPASAKSRYVNEEVRLFKSRHPDRPVIPLIVDGKPDDPERQCFPPALKFRPMSMVRSPASGSSCSLPTRAMKATARTSLLPRSSPDCSASPRTKSSAAPSERRAATRRKRRVQILVGVLVSGIVLGLVGWWNQTYLRERIYWFTNVRPYLLTADAERALKSKDIFQECTDCPAMVVVPSGSFTMGSPDDPKSERNFAGPQREVTIAEPFAVSKYEVTFAEWDACVAALGCPRLTDEEWGRGERPAINLTWDEAQRYATWLNKLMGRPYRLLSETEWEYAARAGTTTLFSFGDNEAVLGEYAWYNGNSDLKTHPVGEKKPNGFGLYDMHGNVWEWVQDCWHDSYDGAPTDGSAWTTGYDCGDRVLRGGSFGERDGNLASAERYWFPTNSRATNFGFRVARTLTP